MLVGALVATQVVEDPPVKDQLPHLTPNLGVLHRSFWEPDFAYPGLQVKSHWVPASVCMPQPAPEIPWGAYLCKPGTPPRLGRWQSLDVVHFKSDTHCLFLHWTEPTRVATGLVHLTEQMEPEDAPAHELMLVAPETALGAPWHLSPPSDTSICT